MARAVYHLLQWPRRGLTGFSQLSVFPDKAPQPDYLRLRP